MSYRIEYDFGAGKYEVTRERSLIPGFFICFSFFLFFTFLCWPAGWDVLLDMLIPGEDSVTIRAFQNMAGDLRSGADM